MSPTPLDPYTLRELARELDSVADDASKHMTDTEQYLAGYCASLAATYRTRAMQIDLAWNAPTRELPIVARGKVRARFVLPEVYEGPT